MIQILELLQGEIGATPDFAFEACHPACTYIPVCLTKTHHEPMEFSLDVHQMRVSSKGVVAASLDIALILVIDRARFVRIHRVSSRIQVILPNLQSTSTGASWRMFSSAETAIVSASLYSRDHFINNLLRPSKWYVA
jgi:hypothetical protein